MKVGDLVTYDGESHYKGIGIVMEVKKSKHPWFSTVSHLKIQWPNLKGIRVHNSTFITKIGEQQ